MEGNEVKYSLITQSGQTIKTGRENSSFIVSKNGLSKGLYCSQVSHSKGLEIKKIVIN